MKFLKTLSGLMSIFILIILLLAASPESSIAIQNQALADGYNGDPFADLVVGAPGENIYDSTPEYEHEFTGMIHVIFGFPQGLSAQENETWHQDMQSSKDQAEADDRFGNTLASGDFNGDGYYDVAVGMPSEDVGEEPDAISKAGAVHVIYGSSSGGLTSVNNQFWHQDSPDINNQAEVEDQFGRALAVGNFNGDDYDDLAVGVPFQDLERSTTIVDAGCVVVIYGSAGGLSATAVLPDQMWHQDNPDIIDNAEEYDNFGRALAAGNFDNDNYDDLAIGAPGESSSEKMDIGVVHVLYGTSAGLSAARNQQWEQFDWGGGAESENFDYFGDPLAVGNFDGDDFDDLAVGVPNEDIETPSTTIREAGAVNILFGSDSGLKKDRVQFLYQDGDNIVEDAEKWDHFGSELAAVNFNGVSDDYLVVGVPDEKSWRPRSKRCWCGSRINQELVWWFCWRKLEIFSPGYIVNTR